MHTRYSSRRQILVGIFVAMLLILGGVGWVAKSVSEHETKQVFSARLATSARVLEALVARQLEAATINNPIVISLPPELEQPGNDHVRELGHPYENELVFQVWSADGVLLARSQYAPTERLAPSVPGFSKKQAVGYLWQLFVLQSGSVWIVAGERDDVRAEIAQDIGLSILLPLIIGGLLLIFIVNQLAMKSIRAVERMSQVIAERDPLSTEPIDARYMPTEIDPVVKAINSLIKRSNELVWREQRFIDAAAHELRTPIAAIQLHLQNALRADQRVEQQSSLESAIEASRRVTRLADQLLFYSRLNAENAVSEKKSMNLAETSQEVAAMIQPLLDRRQQVIEFNPDSVPNIFADKSQIERLIRNLLENAAIHGQMPGTIDLVLRSSPNYVELIVENDGSSIPDSEKERVFIPYYSISRQSGLGSGLGLAIVSQIAQQHGAEVMIQDKSTGQGTRVTVRFPLSEGAGNNPNQEGDAGISTPSNSSA
ncbi:MAG: sensor histidine kinase [Oxalobacteraceae bacterium]|nr:sensor histidine kinase [Oxalobacteraceae bacterium]